MLNSLLAHPLTRNLDLDSPQTTALRRQIIMEKPFLRRIYDDWYSEVISQLPQVPGAIVELGSGGGFLQMLIPDLISSEIFYCPNVSAVFDACKLPFPAGSLKAIVMIDVLHHIPTPRLFFAEAIRCLRENGRIILIEPWVSTWSRFIYTHLHHEPFEPGASDWSFPASGPLSGANGALPWIMFSRDRDRFERDFPQLVIRSVRAFMPVRYLISGGVSTRTIMPEFTYGAWRYIDHLLGRWHHTWPMFASLVIERR